MPRGKHLLQLSPANAPGPRTRLAVPAAEKRGSRAQGGGCRSNAAHRLHHPPRPSPQVLSGLGAGGALARRPAGGERAAAVALPGLVLRTGRPPGGGGPRVPSQNKGSPRPTTFRAGVWPPDVVSAPGRTGQPCECPDAALLPLRTGFPWLPCQLAANHITSDNRNSLAPGLGLEAQNQSDGGPAPWGLQTLSGASSRSCHSRPSRTCGRLASHLCLP